jgi:ATP-dependent Lon protease
MPAAPRKRATRAKHPEVESARLPVLALKDAVVFPRMVLPLLVGRPASVAAIDAALDANIPLLLCTQKEPSIEEPAPEDMYRTGTVAQILQTLRMPDGTLKVIVEGLGRAAVEEFFMQQAPAMAQVSPIQLPTRMDRELKGLMRSAVTLFSDYARLTQRIAPEIVMSVEDTPDPDLLVDTLCAYLPLRVAERQELLDVRDSRKRLTKLNAFLMRENDLISIEQTVRNRVREQMESAQREHFLQEQLRAIHQELGSREEGGDDFTDLRKLVQEAGMPQDVQAKANRELSRFERLPMMSPESGVIRSYIETLCDVPWSARTEDTIDLERAREILDTDHYGLEKVKERILEFLAVRKLKPGAKGSILCLVGPPGVGKTSLGHSIAQAMGREFVRVSLGGVRDEAEIRGHRRTYIGAMPGRIIQGMMRAKVRNPVFVLDEIDKMSADFRGDPSSALLEVLDPEQNRAFSDHYLEVDYDLSEVFFLATANNEFDIPYALHDRLEVVRLSGYTQVEKEKIAQIFLLSKQIAANGLKRSDLTLTKDALDTLIQRYTREAGVRELERQVANLCRKVAKRKVSGGHKRGVRLDGAGVIELLGPPTYGPIRHEAEARTGVAIGMAWTQAGGDVLTVETSAMRGKGKLTLTGQLGAVMKESAEAAYTYLRAHAEELQLPAEFYKDTDLHIHLPEGAIPKDGPSAGVALVVSMLSALTRKPPAAALSMTGEITLRGRVLPVGGIREKVIAAQRAGIRTVLLPEENRKDLVEIPKEVRNALDIKFVQEVGEVLELAFGAEKPRKQPRSAKAG